MVNPLDVTPEEVTQLDATQLQILMNRLLDIEVSQVGLPVDALTTSDRINDPDGGIDARIDAPDFSGNEFLPAGASIWQYKAGKSTWPDYEEEAAKTGVRKALQKGCAYVMVLGREINDRQRDEQRMKLQAALDSVAPPDASISLLSASHIAKWATKYPAIWAHLRRSRAGFWSVSAFLQQPQLHQVAYAWSPPTEAIRDAIRAHVNQSAPANPLRIFGHAGVGKTRLLLETFKEPSDAAVYAPVAGDISNDVLHSMCDRPGITGTLLVDECDLQQARHVQGYVSSAQGSLRLVTIGTEEAPDPINQFEVGPVSDDVLREVVLGTNPLISFEQREWIVDKARGFVKLAQALADLVRRSNVDLGRLDVPGLLGELFSKEDRSALTVVALLSHVGWEDDVEAEGRRLSQHVGIEGHDCRRSILRLERKGYVGRIGRYRYVTPELLAIWFAANEWRANGPGLLEILGEALPEMSDRMSNRGRQMSHVDEVVDHARKVLGTDGPFRDLAVLNDRRNARLFGDFSRIAPEISTRTLERIFDGLDAQALRTLDQGRREVAWTLERLVAHRSLFPAAARLLLRLAVAENEHFVNNATGEFQALFNPIGGKTAATGQERLDLLHELIGGGGEDELLIALGALKGAFETRPGYAVSADPGGQVPPPVWTPESAEEHAALRRRAFALLEELLSHDSELVRASAASAALERFRSFFWLGLAEEALNLASRPDLPQDLRRRLGIKADDVITYDHDKPFMTEELLGQLRNLRSSIYAGPLRERLHLRLGTWNNDLHRASRESSEGFIEAENRELNGLVTDLLLEPEVLRDEFDWICSDEAVKGPRFLSILAEHDRTGEWLDVTLEASLGGNRPDLISSYIVGLSRSRNGPDVESVLDDWARDEKTRHLIPFATANLGLSERRVLRLLDLLDKELDPGTLHCLAWTPCDDDLALPTLARLLRAMAAAGDPARGAVWSIISIDITHRSNEAWHGESSGRELLWELAGDPELIGDFADGHASYQWAECANLLVKQDAQRLASAIMDAVKFGRERLYAMSNVQNVLVACFEADPTGAWAAYANSVEDSSVGKWVLTMWGAEAGITEQVGIDTLKRWVDQPGRDRDQRVELVATLTTVDTELTPIIRWIVTEHEGSEEILGRLMTQHGIRSFTGGMAAAEQPRLEAAERWAQDADPAVRRWAARVVDDLERAVDRYRIEDEESERRR